MARVAKHAWSAACLLGLALALHGQDKTLRLTFAGDLMAHEPNYAIKPYSAIYAGVEYLIRDSDLSFVNAEFPIDDSKPCESYPTFNVHQDYPFAAIQAGFDVFSTANNHAADQGGRGIARTQASMAALRERAKRELGRDIFFNGLRPDGEAPPWTLTRIDRGGLRVGFVAVTETLNVPRLKAGVQNADFRAEAPAAFLEWIKKRRAELDLLILSYHWGDEYETRQTPARAAAARQLAAAGVDVLWGNHPHVMQPWYLVDTPRGSCLVLPSCGNFVSAQAWFLGPDQALGKDAPKGDSMLFSASVRVDGQGRVRFDRLEPVLVAAAKTANGQMVVRTLADLARDAAGPWREFYRTRLEASSGLVPGSLEPSARRGLPEEIPERNIPE